MRTSVWGYLLVPITIKTECDHGCGQIEHLGKEYDAWETVVWAYLVGLQRKGKHVEGIVGSCLVLWKVPWSQTVGFPDRPEQSPLEQIAAGLER